MASKNTEIRSKSLDELVQRERELHDQLFKLRFQAATGQTDNPTRIRIARRELARVKTSLTERRREQPVKE